MTHLKGGGILGSDELDKNKEMTDSRWRELWNNLPFAHEWHSDEQRDLREALTTIVIERAARKKTFHWANAQLHGACELCKMSDDDWIAAERAALGVKRD